MLYYLMLLGAAVLFSIQFLFQKKFAKSFGTDFQSALVFSVGTGFGMAVVSFLFAGGRIEITPFSGIVALAHGFASFVFMYCSLKALKVANISVFSVFTMLGGMLLPVFYGVCLAGERLTVGKTICCLLVSVAVICTVNGGKSGKKAMLYYIAVFISNGITSVCAAVHQNYPHINVDSYSYMVLSSLALMLFGIVFMLFHYKNKRKITVKDIAYMTGFSVCSGTGNIIIMLALLVLPASLQFPFSTGAAVVFSAVIALLQHEKITKREIIAVFVAMLSTIFMMF